MTDHADDTCGCKDEIRGCEHWRLSHAVGKPPGRERELLLLNVTTANATFTKIAHTRINVYLHNLHNRQNHLPKNHF